MLNERSAFFVFIHQENNRYNPYKLTYPEIYIQHIGTEQANTPGSIPFMHKNNIERQTHHSLKL